MPAGLRPHRIWLSARRSSLLVKAAAARSKHTAFFLNGEDYPGAVAETLSKLAPAGINAGAVQAVCGGKGRYGAVIFLAQSGVRKAAKALGIS